MLKVKLFKQKQKSKRVLDVIFLFAAENELSPFLLLLPNFNGAPKR
jgi:hypothetical protein